MSRELVYSILGQPSSTFPRDERLESLELDNLHTWSPTNPPLPQKSHLREVSAFIRDCELDGLMVTTQQWEQSRLMIGLLDPLVGRYGALKSLRIATWGTFIGRGEPAPHLPLYVAWAGFLRSVRSTLEEFSFEQGVDRQYFKGWANNPPPCRVETRPTNVDRPMDVLFLEWILPALLESPWPRMKHMEIHGVGRWSVLKCMTLPITEPLPPDREVEYEVRERMGSHENIYYVVRTRIAFTAAAKEKLREVLGDNTTLIIQEDQLRDYEDLEWDNHGVPSIPELPYEE